MPPKGQEHAAERRAARLRQEAGAACEVGPEDGPPLDQAREEPGEQAEQGLGEEGGQCPSLPQWLDFLLQMGLVNVEIGLKSWRENKRQVVLDKCFFLVNPSIIRPP